MSAAAIWDGLAMVPGIVLGIVLVLRERRKQR